MAAYDPSLDRNQRWYPQFPPQNPFLPLTPRKVDSYPYGFMTDEQKKEKRRYWQEVENQKQIIRTQHNKLFLDNEMQRLQALLSPVTKEDDTIDIQRFQKGLLNPKRYVTE